MQGNKMIGVALSDCLTVVQLKRGDKRPVQEDHLVGRQRSDIVGEQGLRKAYEFVTMNAARMFRSLLRADGNLGRKTFISREDRSADDRRESRGYHFITADDDENPELARISRRRTADPVELPAPHRGAW